MKAPRIVALCSIGHTAALGALAGRRARPRFGRGCTRRLRGVRGTRHDPGARLPLPRVGVRRPRAVDAGRERGRHAAPDRRLPVRRRLRVDDVDTAAARGDARGDRRRRADRGVRPSRRLLEPGDEGDPRRRALPVALRAHPRRGDRSWRRPPSGRWPVCTRPAEVLEADHFHQRGFWVDHDDPTRRPRLAARTALPARRGRLAAAPAAPAPPAEPTPRRRARSGWRTGRHRRRPRAAADEPPLRGDPGPRLHDGVVGPVPHAVARRSRRRGDPGREPVGVPAHHEGLPAAAERRRCCSAACCRCTRRRSTGASGPAVQPSRDEQLDRPQQAVVHARSSPSRGPASC